MLLPGRRHFDATKVGSGLDGLSVPPPLKAEGQTGIERLQPFLTRGIRFPEPNAAAFKGVPHHNSPCRFPTTTAIADRKKPPGVLQETLVDEQTNPATGLAAKSSTRRTDVCQLRSGKALADNRACRRRTPVAVLLNALLRQRLPAAAGSTIGAAGELPESTVR